jgi:hypothetical protein
LIPHDLRKPIANPKAPLPVIGSARFVDDVVVMVDVIGNCADAFVSVDIAFWDAIWSLSQLIFTILEILSIH